MLGLVLTLETGPIAWKPTATNCSRDTREEAIKMRDQRFVAAHRGGPLSKEHHRQLITWAADCAEHVLPLFGEVVDERLLNALETARAWAKGEVPVGKAQKASVASHATAREASTPAAVAVARAIGQAVATAHMADHSLGGALYGLLAVQAAGKPIEPERTWQNERLPLEVRELVLSAWEQKNLDRMLKSKPKASAHSSVS
jgi:hypothetical protein